MLLDTGRRGAAEFIGTFAVVFVGAGALAAAAASETFSLTDIALAHGLTIAVMVSALGHISGGHFNPAVTFGLLVTGRLAPLLAVVYWIAQLAAAVLAVLLLKVVFAQDAATEAGVPQVTSRTEALNGAVLEGVLTFFLVFVVFATAVDPRGTFKSIAGLAIGLTITFDVLIGGPLTGAAMNPARAFGPQLVENIWSDAWVYYAGPLVGGALAALAYELLYLRPLAPVSVGPPETGVEEPRPGETAAS